MNPLQNLDEVRAAIDALDRVLVTALGERLRCIAEAARIKGEQGEKRLFPGGLKMWCRRCANRPAAPVSTLILPSASA